MLSKPPAEMERSTVDDYFAWDPATYGLNIGSMDDEHQILIAKMNALWVLHNSDAPFSKVDRSFKDLITYTKQHFADEEAYMERIGYPRLRIHRGIHVQLLDRLAELERECRARQMLTGDLFVFLKMWLKAHICGIDSQYAQHVRNSAVLQA